MTVALTADRISARAEQVTPPVLERYESKYSVPLALVDDIVAFVMPYCAMDRYSEIAEGGYYQINSLYFDSPSYHFLRQRIAKAENRFNMRVRSYGDDPVPPFFLEVKQRKGDTVRKYRARYHDTDVRPLLECTGGLPGQTPVDQANQDLFVHLATRFDARPVVLLQYRRKALFSICDDYARVTFDTDLRYMPPPGYRPVPDERQMTPCGLESRFGREAILELKCCPGNVPLWMVDLVRTFGLTRRGFSKYSTCIRPLVERHDAGDGLLRSTTFAQAWQE